MIHNLGITLNVVAVLAVPIQIDCHGFAELPFHYFRSSVSKQGISTALVLQTVAH